MAKHRRYLIPVLVLVVGACVLVWWFWRTPGRPYREPERVFDGDSENLKETLVVPTLETPIPEGKSAIWCSSFQLAWNQLRKDVVGEPIRLQNAAALADELNAAEALTGDLSPEHYYAAAGLIRDGIVKRIQSDMAGKFPHVPTSDLSREGDVALAYSYLSASLKFDHPYFDNDEPFSFVSSGRHQTPVASFGVREKDDYAYKRLREQVEILWHPNQGRMAREGVNQFIVDPCRYSTPYQMVLACVERQESLGATVRSVEAKIKHPPWKPELGPNDTLLIPEMHWRITHHFKELEGRDKAFLNPRLQGLYLGDALQVTDFKLDRSGAELRSEAKHHVKPVPDNYHFDRPFLIVMKKRDAKHPFFVMWVDNAELLCKR